MNRLHTAAFGNKSPYELLFKRQATLHYLRMFGCLCFATTVPKGDKFEERARPAALIGYSELQKGYILLDLKTNKLFVR